MLIKKYYVSYVRLLVIIKSKCKLKPSFVSTFNKTQQHQSLIMPLVRQIIKSRLFKLLIAIVILYALVQFYFRAKEFNESINQKQQLQQKQPTSQTPASIQDNESNVSNDNHDDKEMDLLSDPYLNINASNNIHIANIDSKVLKNKTNAACKQ